MIRLVGVPVFKGFSRPGRSPQKPHPCATHKDGAPNNSKSFKGGTTRPDDNGQLFHFGCIVYIAGGWPALPHSTDSSPLHILILLPYVNSQLRF